MVHNNNTVPVGVQEPPHNGPVFRAQGRRRGFPLPSKLLDKQGREVTITQQAVLHFLVLVKHRD